jgi:hypothetical protein
MCRLAPNGSAALGPETIRRLARYHFRDPVHQVIFDTLCELRKSAPSESNAWSATVREHLASRLTLTGFPEFDIDSLLSNVRIEEGALQRWISELTATPDAL